MRYEKAVTNVCDHCTTLHNKYFPEIQFNAFEKQSAYKCFSCKADMCKHCLEHSMNELDGTICYSVKRYACKKCLEHRQTIVSLAERIIAEHLEEGQKQFQQEIVYPVTKQTWKSLS